MKTIEPLLLLPNFERAWDNDPDSVRTMVAAIATGADLVTIRTLEQRLHSKKRRMGRRCDGTKAVKIPITPQEIDFFIYALDRARARVNYETDFPPTGIEVALTESLKNRIAPLKANDFSNVIRFLDHSETWRRNQLRLLGGGTTQQIFVEWHQSVSRTSEVLVSSDKDGCVTGVITTFQDDAHRASIGVCLDPIWESYGLLEEMVKNILLFTTENYRVVEMRLPSSWQLGVATCQRLEFEGKPIAYIPSKDQLGEEELEILFQINPRKFASNYYKEAPDGAWMKYDCHQADSAQ